MSEEKFDASVPVWVEIVPTVIEFEVTPGAPPPEDAAPASVAGANSVAPLSVIPVSAAVAISALVPLLTRIRPPFKRCVLQPLSRGHCNEGAQRIRLTIDSRRQFDLCARSLSTCELTHKLSLSRSDADN